MMAEELVSRLHGVKRRGQGRWVACCPAHEDRTPSLGVRELEDQRILLHCFAGCSVHAIVAAVGLSMSDLFPPNSPGETRPQGRRGIHPFDAMACLIHEATVLTIIAEDMIRGRPLEVADRERLTHCLTRISAAIEVARV